jgi:hypothetical protein
MKTQPSPYKIIDTQPTLKKLTTLPTCLKRPSSLHTLKKRSAPTLALGTLCSIARTLCAQPNVLQMQIHAPNISPIFRYLLSPTSPNRWIRLKWSNLGRPNLFISQTTSLLLLRSSFSSSRAGCGLRRIRRSSKAPNLIRPLIKNY